MKIDFVENAQPPTLRIFAGTAEAYRALESAIRAALTSGGFELAFDALPGVKTGLALRGDLALRDMGVTKVGPASFHWALDAEGWETVADLIAPVAEAEGSFQWLCGPEARFGLDVGTIGVLLSHSGEGTW